MIEIIQKDLLGRIAKFRTKSGIIETPTFIPVVHPTRELIQPRKMFEDFGCQILITNAYLLSKTGSERKIHDLLDFPGAVMTDSGAYQLLIYGDVDITPKQIIQLQERIETDIAVILDVPTGGKATYSEAKFTVDETLRRATDSISQRQKSDILWVGPIQGGTYTDLVEKSARKIRELDFSIYAIGSPTQLMEQYQFDKLVDLVLTAKKNIPGDKPVHLFGAGHPLVFPLIVAMGCDMFDSAAYALFAKHDRMLFSEGTYRLTELQDEFCNCPTCSQYTISEMKHLEKRKRVQVLAEHNLYICQNEINRIKHAIREGHLWRLVESRLSSHPALVDAMKRLQSYQPLFEQLSPITKKRAIYITSTWSLFQPEIYRHKKRMEEYSPPHPMRHVLMLFSTSKSSPYHTAKEYELFCNEYNRVSPASLRLFDTMFVSPVFNLVPLELTNYYPLAQHVAPQSNFLDLDPSIIDQLRSYLLEHPQYTQIFGFFGQDPIWQSFTRRCRKMLKELKKQFILSTTDFSKKSLNSIISKIILEF